MGNLSYQIKEYLHLHEIRKRFAEALLLAAKKVNAISIEHLIVKRFPELFPKQDVKKRFRNQEIFPEKPKFPDHWKNSNPKNFPGKKHFLVTDQDIKPEPLTEAQLIRSTLNLDPGTISNSVFYIYFLCDSDALPEIRNIIHNGGVLIPHLDASKTEYRFVNSIALKAISATLMMSDRISHFNALVHENICEALEITKNITGDYVEIGVYKGGSALTALNYVNIASSIGESVRRNFWLLDTFDGFNYDTASNSSDVIWSGTHKLFGPKETMDFIETTLKDIPLTRNLVQCNICEASLPSSIQKIAVANIDVDIYEATRDSLRKVSPLIQPGGIIICEDPTSTPALYGALLAMEEFLSTNEGKRYTKIFKRGQYFLIKEKT